MKNYKVYYQPASDGSKTAWLLTFCLFMISPIWASELFYNLNGLWLLYTVALVFYLAYRLSARYIVLRDKVMYLHQLRFWRVEEYSFSNEKVHFSFEKRTLVIEQDGHKQRRLFMTKKACQQLKEELNG
ncbi:EbsA family protein [Fructobacillus sp. M1-13]|uniref:EbsA family protein n=1 Tax=Fructobacillus papyriferae TaxID=2713171 RepID=A0ABS5QR36_9LACO|nr:EbsA family protein [Fructobacillus papyriferae]MBS9334799.1 EbsA family protein [Fructobacillus papyriferae]MCD2158789.1 EbsA family protein [Fructobacillus papyriferae]